MDNNEKRSLRPRIQEEPQGAEVLTRVERAVVRKLREDINPKGQKREIWQTTLQGYRKDGTKAEETFSARISREMAIGDVPEGVDIVFEDQNKGTD